MTEFLDAATIPFISLVLTLVGALVGSWITRSNERSQRIAQLLKEFVVESVDLAYKFEAAMHTFTTYAPQAQPTAETATQVAEAERLAAEAAAATDAAEAERLAGEADYWAAVVAEAHMWAEKADNIAGEALGSAKGMQQDLRRTQGRISLVGSQKLVDSFAAFQAATDSYMDEVATQFNTDAVFRGAPATAFLKKYAAALDEYANAARKELGRRGEILGGNQRNFDAVQVNPPTMVRTYGDAP